MNVAFVIVVASEAEQSLSTAANWRDSEDPAHALKRIY